MEGLFEKLASAKTIAIAGHIRPDGDCIGSCLAMYNYLMENYNENQEKVIDVFLEQIPDEFLFLKGAKQVKKIPEEPMVYDVFLSLDCGSPDRLGVVEPWLHTAKTSICIDHHISNTKFANINHVVANASSTCEVLYMEMEQENISLEVAECLYVGIVHDTGVFKHSNTSKQTMIIAAELLEKGVSSSKMIDETFYQKTYVQNQILGRCLLESILVLDGKVIFSVVSRKIQELYGTVPSDLSGVIDQLRITKGVEVAILLREESFREYKVSLRSNGIVNVSEIAVGFGGGGHIKAAGCTMQGSVHDVVNNLTKHIEYQLNHAK